MDKATCFFLGYVAKLHGYKGEVSLFLDVTNPEEYRNLDVIYIEINEQLTPFFIQAFKPKNKGFAAVKLEGVDSEADAMRILRKSVYLPESYLPKLEDVHFYDHEVVGYTVIDQKYGNIGILEEVVDLKGNPLIRVMKENKEILIPFHDQLVQHIDRVKKEMHILAPEGLIDLYLS